MSVDDRWWLRGRLETRGLLHVGSGDTVTRKGLVDERTRKAAQVSAVAVDWRGRPYVPGSTLKGVLRAWATPRAEKELVERVFGSQDRGGGVVFADAPMAGDPDPANPPPYWCEERRTGVVPRVAIDRRFGTASHRRLFYLEVVAPGTELEVEIGADSLGEEEMALVLAALGGFEDGGELALGAHTGDGWGRLSWHLDEVRRMGRDDVIAWIDAGAPNLAGDAATPLPKEAERALLERAGEVAASGEASARVGVELELRFDSPFLVRDTDPAHAGSGLDRPDAVARCDGRGLAHLPASSFRGALRSRAEKILRTLGRGDGAACGIDAPREPCGSVESVEEVQRLCPACRVFGAAGWRAPLAVVDFTAQDAAVPVHQHFVAVDRFTGGAANQRKFDVKGVVAPRLRGRVDLDLVALTGPGHAACGPWALGLLILALRDIVEGDVTFGAGAARGYGVCRARIASVIRPEWEALPETLRTALGLAPDDLAGELVWPARSSTLGSALTAWVEELEDVAERAQREWQENRPRQEEKS